MSDLYYPYPENINIKNTPENNMSSFHNKPEPSRREIIKVIAVGGGGSNALNHIITKGLEGVDLLAVNTDIRSLDMSLSKNKIILGEKVTKGLGAGALPEIGEMAARESLSEIREYLKGTDMVYLTGGMGGGTGTGALPVIAAAAKDMGILTVAVVTKPFIFEGIRRMRYAEEGIAKLRSCVDALIVVPNDRLLEISRRETPLNESFSMVDEVLRQAVQGVTDLVTRPGMVNVDFADLKSVMRQAGPAVMGVGRANGENRIDKAIKEALESPLMECSMQGAKGVLMNITCGDDLGIFEVQQAAAYIEDIISDDAVFVWGCVEDSELEGSVEIVIVATGFENGERMVCEPPKEKQSLIQPPVQQNQSAKQRPVWHDPQKSESCHEVDAVKPQTEDPATSRPEQSSPLWLRVKEEVQDSAAILQKFPSDQYDLPTFLRRNKIPVKPQIN
jgi:cell division protein FtsZ